MGFLAMAFDERFAASAEQVGRVPTYEAYQAFDEGMNVLIDQYNQLGALPHFLRAFELDSTFYTALIYACIPAINLDDLGFVDSLVGVLAAHADQLSEYDRHWDSLVGVLAAHADQLSEYDRHWMRMVQGTLAGDAEAALQAITSAAQIAPQSRATYIRSYLLEVMNRPREELEVLAAVDPNRGGMRGLFMYWARVCLAHRMLGEHSQELDAARRAREQYPDEVRFPFYEARALIGLGQVDEARQLLDEVGVDAFDYYEWAGQALRVHGHIDAAREVFFQAIEWLRALPPEEAKQPQNRYRLADALYAVEEWTEAQEIAEGLVTEIPEVVRYLGLLGLTVARLGDRERALHVSEQLAAMDADAVFWYDDRTEWRAGIASVLGEHMEALRLLQEEFRRGWLSLGVLRSADFDPLRDYPEFQELMRPKG
jgi:tetratricopeptide (TPR) repeat protein